MHKQRHRFFVSWCSLLLGILLAFFYDIFRALRKTIYHSERLVAFEDFLFWMICSFFIFFLFYYCNDGNIRFYVILGIILGILFYIFVCTSYAMKFLLIFFRVFTIAIKNLFLFLHLPVKFFRKLLANPLKKIYQTIRIVLRTR